MIDIDEIIARVERLDREATEGPWQAGTHEGGFEWFVDELAAGRRVADGSWNVADAALIAAYRSDAPALAAEVRRLRAEIEKAGQLAEVVNDVADRLDRRWQSETFNGDEDARRLRTALAGEK